MNQLKLAAYLAYLASWLLFLIGGVVLSIPFLSRPRRAPRARSLGGLALQVAAGVAATLLIPRGPLTVGAVGQAAVLVLAPVSAMLFSVTAGIARRAKEDELVTRGPFRLVRHPMYLSIYGMLAATTILMASPAAFALATTLYVAGTEMRVVAEERDLEARFGEAWRAYRARVRCRYLPGVR